MTQKLVGILEKCDSDVDCYGYQFCKRYLNSAHGYCIGKVCNTGKS